MKTKLIFMAVVLVLTVFCAVSIVFAQSSTDIQRQALINQIQSQIAQIQFQVNQMIAQAAISTGNAYGNGQSSQNMPALQAQLKKQLQTQDLSKLSPASVQALVASVQSSQSTLLVNLSNQAITSDTSIPLTNLKSVISFYITGTAKLNSDNSVVRILLIDDKNKQYLVYNSGGLTDSIGTEIKLSKSCKETCLFGPVNLVKLQIIASNATVTLPSATFAISTSLVNPAFASASAGNKSVLLKSNMDIQAAAELQKVQTMVKQKKLNWTAGDTPIAHLSYEQLKKRLLIPGKKDLPDNLNLQEIEYYKGGIIGTVSGQQKKSAVSSAGAPSSWDWRNVNGTNWLTPIRDQGDFGNCFAFASTGAFEAQINKAVNKNVGVKLSPQTEVDCLYGGMQLSPWFSFTRDNTGIPVYKKFVDENCDGYDSRDFRDANGNIIGGACDTGHICGNYQERTWTVDSYKNISPSSADELRAGLRQYGPLAVTFVPWDHAMVLTGYGTNSNGDYYIFKNSWGTDWGGNNSSCDNGICGYNVDDDGYTYIFIAPDDVMSELEIANIPQIGGQSFPTNLNYWPAGVCKPNWQCGSWGACSNGIQNRTCTDANNCNPELAQPQTTQTCTPFTLTSPNGGEQWEKGSTHKITWDANGYANDLTIEYTSDMKSYSSIGVAHASVGSYSWIIPSSLAVGKYKICLLSVSGSCSNDWFTITSCTPKWTCTNWSGCTKNWKTRTCTDSNNCGTTTGEPDTTQSCCAIMSPADGNSWERGTTHNVTWDTTGCTGNLAINLGSSRNANTTYGISSSVPASTGTTSWAIPATISPDNQYKIGVYDLINKKQLRWSNNFSITCTPQWSCGAWNRPCVNGQETRTCTDAKNCGTTVGRPPITEACTCTPKWNCSAWSPCKNGQQSETCTDSNNCGLTSGKPPATQSCVPCYLGEPPSLCHCNPNWQCTAWGPCVPNGSGKKHVRTCTDLNNCGAAPGEPAITESCAQSSLNFISPAGGEQWQQGMSHNIKWNTAGGYSGKIQIMLAHLNSGEVNKQIASGISVPATNTFGWNISSSLSPGEYQIEVFDVNSGLLSTSNTFDIISNQNASPITVTSPVGGEKWAQGSTQSITWTSSGVNNVVINLVNDSPGAISPMLKIAAVSAYSGSYTWKVPSSDTINFPLGNKYKIEIFSADSNAPFPSFARSPDYFSVVASTLPTLLSSSATTTATLGGTIQIKCNFGANTPPCVGASSGGPGNCTFIGLQGNDAVFNCKAVKLGVQQNICSIFYSSQDPRCSTSQTNIIQSTTVSNACTPNWSCVWGPCVNGSQSQVATDLNNCGTTVGKITCSTPTQTCGIITITSPNGGEQWEQGSTHNVTWTSAGVKNVQIIIYNDSATGSASGAFGLAGSVQSSSGYYSFKIPSNGSAESVNFPLGSKYKIEISDIDPNISPAIYSKSAGYFSIVAPPSSLNTLQDNLASLSDALNDVALKIRNLLSH